MSFKSIHIEYQKRVVQKLIDRSLYYRDNKESGLFVLKMPTGSGKTYTDFLYSQELFLKDKRAVLVFLTLGQADLHKQAQRKFDLYSNNKISTYSIPQIMNLKKVKGNSVFFLNWESLNKTDRETNDVISIFNKDYHESKTTYPMFCEMLKDFNVYLIVDEFHSGGGTLKSDELVKKLNPILQINQSATPSFLPSTKEDFLEISLREVQEDEVIVKGFKINHGFHENLVSLDKMIYKSLELSNEIQKESILESKEFIPLIGIQIPNGNLGRLKLKEVKDILNKYQINEENGSLFIHLNDEKTNEKLHELDSSSSKVRVLIFKQSIATGWDCSRAKIWVKLRDIKKESFNIQTGGRFLRTVHKKYFKNDILNYAYLFTDQDDFSYDDGFYIPNKIQDKALFINLNKDLKLDDFFLKNSILDKSKASCFYKIDIYSSVFEKFIKENNIHKKYNKENLLTLEKLGFDISLKNKRSIIGESSLGVQSFVSSEKVDFSSNLSFELGENEPTFKLKSLFKIDYCHDFEFERSWSAFLSCMNKISSLFYENNSVYYFHCLMINPKNWALFCALTKDNLLNYQESIRVKSKLNSKESIFSLAEERTASSENNVLVPLYNSVYGVKEKKWIDCIISSKRGDNHSDSQVEQNFFNTWNSLKIKDLFIIRNGTNTEGDFRIPYINPLTKEESGFFPDLILLQKTEKGYRTFIFEIKSEQELKRISSEDPLVFKQKSLMNYVRDNSCEKNEIKGGLIVEVKGSSGLSFFRVFDKDLSIKELTKKDFSSGIDLEEYLMKKIEVKAS